MITGSRRLGARGDGRPRQAIHSRCHSKTSHHHDPSGQTAHSSSRPVPSVTITLNTRSGATFCVSKKEQANARPRASSVCGDVAGTVHGAVLDGWLMTRRRSAPRHGLKRPPRQRFQVSRATRTRFRGERSASPRAVPARTATPPVAARHPDDSVAGTGGDSAAAATSVDPLVPAGRTVREVISKFAELPTVAPDPWVRSRWVVPPDTLLAMSSTGRCPGDGCADNDQSRH